MSSNLKLRLAIFTSRGMGQFDEFNVPAHPKYSLLTGLSGACILQASERTPDSEKKPAGKKESADSSGSSLLEFAFQSALFGNTLFGDKDASPTPPQGVYICLKKLMRKVLRYTPLRQCPNLESFHYLSFEVD